MKKIKYLLRQQNVFAILLSTALICFALTVSATATAPVNDNLPGALVLSGASGTVNGNTVDATREEGEYTHDTSATIVYRTVWFQWTAPETKPVIFEVTATGGFDAAMAVYTGSSYPLNGITRNNNTIGNRPHIEFAAVAGTTYRIVVGLFNNPNTQGGNFTLEWVQNTNPTNDNFNGAMNLETFQMGSVAVTNQNATKETGEPTHIAGSKSIWFNFTNNQPTDCSITFSTRTSYSPSLDTTLSVYTGSSVENLSPVVKNDNVESTSRSRVTFLAKAGVTYRIAIDEGANPNGGDILLSWGITRIKGYTDFGVKNEATAEVNYDDAADISVFRHSNGVWYWLNSSGNAFGAFQFGLNGDAPVPGDYDGDGRTDLAITRHTVDGKIWYIHNSFDDTYTILQWGLQGDKPVTGDYDADGRVDLAVFRPSTGIWYIRRSSDGEFIIKEFGFNTDIPVSGDFAGTGPGTDIAVFRPSNGTWYILNGDHTIFAPFGLSGDTPVTADYDNDGKTDIALFRPSNGIWYVLKSRNNQLQTVQWGMQGDIPQPGDYDNNTNDLADFAVFRQSDNTWYILKSEGTQTAYVKFGMNGDLPVAANDFMLTY